MVAIGSLSGAVDLRGWLDRRARDVWDESLDIIILGVDGLRADVAAQELRPTSAWTADAVFPTNSFPGWFSALTGADVATHGVPGVVFGDPGTGKPVNLLEQDFMPSYRGGTVFTDAAGRGDAPYAVLNDLALWHNSVTAQMLCGAQLVTGIPHLRGTGRTTPRSARNDLHAQVTAARGRARPRRCLAWVFVELDVRVHRTGYDAVVREWLAELQRLAVDLVSEGCVVVLHSDHGLVPTTHRPDLRDTLERIVEQSGGRLGGAGRTCWVSVPPGGDEQDLAAQLRHLLGDVAEVVSRDTLFPRGTPGWRAVGDLVAIARGEEFPTPTTDPFEHGARTPGEIRVPVLVWEP